MATSILLLAATLSSGAAAARFAHFATNSSAATCSSSLPLSCQNTTSISSSDLCCFNTPGGSLLQTQFWDTDPTTGPTDSWTIHGLWPDECDGNYQSSCDGSRAYTNISSILTNFGESSTLSYMNTYWKNDPDSGSDESFWEHEWSKHGTCINTLSPSCFRPSYATGEEAAVFFKTTVALFKTLPTYDWLGEAGIAPSSSTTYTSKAILAALKAKHGENPVIMCSGGALNQVYYYFNVHGSVNGGTFVPAPSDGSTSNCPASGIKYLPKTGS